MQTRYRVIDTAEREHVVGVAFKPGGTVPFIRVPAHETCDADIVLEFLSERRRAVTLRERLLSANGTEAKLDALERALLDAFRCTNPHPCVAFALDTFSRRPVASNIRAVTNAIGLSPKRFIERFKAEVRVTRNSFVASSDSGKRSPG